MTDKRCQAADPYWDACLDKREVEVADFRPSGPGGHVDRMCTAPTFPKLCTVLLHLLCWRAYCVEDCRTPLLLGREESGYRSSNKKNRYEDTVTADLETGLITCERKEQ